MVSYKLWLQVERIDEKRDTYDNIDEPLEMGVFSTEREAIKAAVKLHKANWPDCPCPHCELPITDKKTKKDKTHGLRPARFQLDGIEGVFNGFTKGETWNGFACPLFDPEQAISFAKAYKESGSGRKAYFSATAGGWYFRIPESGVDELFTPVVIGMDRYYPIGYAAWIWSEVTGDDDEDDILSNNQRRIDNGQAMFAAYCKRRKLPKIETEQDYTATDLITDVLHYARSRGWDAERLMRCAADHLEAETVELCDTCGNPVTHEDAEPAEREGKTVYYCSDECKGK